VTSPVCSPPSALLSPPHPRLGRCLRIREDGKPSAHLGPLSKGSKGKTGGEDDEIDEEEEDLIPWDLIVLDGRSILDLVGSDAL